MNTCYQDLVSAAKEVEETFEDIDMYMLNTESQKKVESFLSKCSNVVKCDKMLMKATRTVFSKVHVQKRLEENSDNVQEKGHLCEICSNFLIHSTNLTSISVQKNGCAVLANKICLVSITYGYITKNHVQSTHVESV